MKVEGFPVAKRGAMSIAASSEYLRNCFELGEEY